MLDFIVGLFRGVELVFQQAPSGKLEFGTSELVFDYKNVCKLYICVRVKNNWLV